MSNRIRMVRADKAPAARRIARRNRSRRLLSATTSLAGLLALMADASGATFTYTPTSGTTDLWSAGTNWSAVPVSDPSTELTFVGNNATALTNFTNTNTDDISSAFQLNILDLQGTGPAATGAATININSASPSTGLNLLSNGAATPIVNLNANNGSQQIIYNINAPVTLSNDTVFTGNGSGVFNFFGGINAPGVTLNKTGTSTLRLNGTNTIGSLSLAAGGLAIGASSTTVNGLGMLTITNLATIGTTGVGTLNVGTASNSGDTFGTLDLSGATSVIMNLATVNIGITANSNGVSSGTIKLPTSSNIIATSAFNVGTSGGARNGDNNVFVQFLNTAAGAGINTISTPTFAVNGNKSSGLVTIGAGNTLSVTGVTGGRASQIVGLQNGGGGGGNYIGMLDGSQGIYQGNLSNLVIGAITDGGNPSGNTTGIVTLSNSASNLLNISGAGGTAAGGNGVVAIGRDDVNATGIAAGVLTIGNLDPASSITNTTSNGNAFLIGGGVVANNKPTKGTVNLNGGAVTITTAGTAGAAFAGGTHANSNSNINFNGTKIVAGSSSSNWIKNITNANVGAGGAIFDTNGNSVTIAQPLVHSNVGTVTGINVTNSGSYTIATTGNYPAGYPLVTLAQAGNAAAFGVGEPTIVSGAVTGIRVLAAENFTAAPTVSITAGTITAGGVAATSTASFTPAAAVDGGLTKLGQGTLTLTGTNTYNGATTVNAGTLNLTGSVASNITIADAAALAGTGSTSGGLTFQGSSQFLVTPGSGFFQSNTADASGATVLIVPTTALSSTPTVILNAPGGITGSIGTNFVLQSRASLTENGNTQLLLAVSGSNVITWTGANSNAWDIQTTKNWTNLGASDFFFNADNVNFDDNASTFTVNVVAGGVLPATATFANNAHDYTLTGGAIGGGGSVTFNGSRTVTVTNNNTYSGGTTINSGTVQLGDGTNPGGSILGNITNGSAIAINYGANNGSFNNNLSGAGSLNVNGSGSISVTGSNTYSGATNINGATVVLPANGSLGSGNILNNGALVTTGTTSLPNNSSGTGSLLHTTGTLTLTGNNTFTGGTTINTGATVSVGAGTTSGGLSGPVVASGTLMLNRSDDVTITSAISGSGALNKAGSGVATLTVNPTVRNITLGNNTAGGTLIFPAGSTVALGDGSGLLIVGSSTTASNGTAALDASGLASFTANFDQINVGTAANANGFASGKLLLPSNSSLTGATQIMIGDSTGARNQQDDNAGTNIRLTTGAGGTTKVRTPLFSVGRSKTSASLMLGAGNTFDLAGTGTTPRTLMGVGNMLTGGGGGNYYQTADFSAGILNANLSGLQIGLQNNNSGATSSNLNATMIIGSDPANHLDISGVPVGPTAAQSGVVLVAATADAASTGLAQGTLTIGNLDATSAITVTDGAGGIGSGNAILVGGAVQNGSGAIFSLGTLNLNGGTLTITTTGTAIAGPGAGAGIAFVNFNGTTLKAGASSTNWINNILINGGGGGSSGAFVGDGGIRIDTNGFAVTVPQQLLAAGSGGLTKYGPGTLTMTGNNGYSGASVITGGALVVNNAAQNVIFNNGGADVQSGRLIFDYSNGGTDPIGQVLPILQAGFNQATKFSSGQIRSSTATNNRGLGYIDDGTAQHLTVAYTYFGDANLDGAVNGLDFNALATSFGSAGAWVQGDFNYDGAVNTLDFDALATNFNQTLPLPAPSVSELNRAALGALVPEPASLGLIATFGLCARRRRAL